jgi:hypothetical protein
MKMVTQNKLAWIGRVISGLLSLLFVMSAVMKLKGGTDVIEGMAHLGLSGSLLVPLGILEVSCVALYLIPATSMLGAILLTGYLGGAILAHLRVDDAFIFQVVLGVCVWLGVYLRENRLRALIPLRTSGTVDFASPRSTNG